MLFFGLDRSIVFVSVYASCILPDSFPPSLFLLHLSSSPPPTHYLDYFSRWCAGRCDEEGVGPLLRPCSSLRAPLYSRFSPTFLTFVWSAALFPPHACFPHKFPVLDARPHGGVSVLSYVCLCSSSKAPLSALPLIIILCTLNSVPWPPPTTGSSPGRGVRAISPRFYSHSFQALLSFLLSSHGYSPQIHLPHLSLAMSLFHTRVPSRRHFPLIHFIFRMVTFRTPSFLHPGGLPSHYLHDFFHRLGCEGQDALVVPTGFYTSFCHTLLIGQH